MSEPKERSFPSPEEVFEWMRFCIATSREMIEEAAAEERDPTSPSVLFLRRPEEGGERAGDVVLLLGMGGEREKDLSALMARAAALQVRAVATCFVTEAWMFGGPPERGSELYRRGRMPSQDPERVEILVATTELPGDVRQYRCAIRRFGGEVHVGEPERFAEDATSVRGRFVNLLLENQEAMLRETGGLF